MAKLSAYTKNTTGLNSGYRELSQIISLNEINVKDLFANLIPIKENDLDSITESMKVNGFDQLHPVCIWKEHNILVDGHTRRQAAIKAGLSNIYCFKKSFSDEKEAITYAINEQLQRRNLDDAGKIILIEKLDNLKKKGRPIANSMEVSKGKSSTELAKTLGISTSKVEKARSVLKNADEDTKNAIKAGELSINKAYDTIKIKKKLEKQVNSLEETEQQDPFAVNDIYTIDEPINKKNEITYTVVLEELLLLQEKKLQQCHSESEKSLIVEIFEELMNILQAPDL